MTDFTSLESIPQCHWNRSSTPRRLPANCHVFRCPLAQFERRFIAERTRDGMNAACQGEPALTTSAQSGKARSQPVTGQGRHVVNCARTLNALLRIQARDHACP
jgi:hypothetical protein